MKKLPEPPERKKRRCMRKKRNRLGKRKKT